MILGIDVGNTTTVFALIDTDALGENNDAADDGQNTGTRTSNASFPALPKIIAQSRGDTHPTNSVGNYLAMLHNLATSAGVARTAISQAIISSVVPSAMPTITEAAERFPGRAPHIVNAADASDYGITIDAPAPEIIGGDIIADCV